MRETKLPLGGFLSEVLFMPITSQNAVTQAIANIKLESLSLPAEVLKSLNKALSDGSVNTTDILDLLRGG